MGFQGLFPIVFCVLEEIIDNSLRQRIQTFIQAFICFGGLVSIGLFYTIKNWYPIYLYFGLIPMTLLLIFTFVYLKETPQFMIKLYEINKIRSDLEFIAK